MRRLLVVMALTWEVAAIARSGGGVRPAHGVAATPVIAHVEPVGPPGLGTTAADCGSCHAAALAEWSTSRHRAAATNPIFRAAWEHWPNGWCLGCHAPDEAGQVALIGRAAVPGLLAGPRPAPEPGPWEEGVSCAVCHVSDGAIVSSHAPSDAAQAAHPVTVRADFGSPGFCGGCHEFPFQLHTPEAPFAYSGDLSQETVREWRSSAAARAGDDCTTCHMPDGAHTFPGAHTPDLVRDALQVEAGRAGDKVTLTLTADAPHRIPTGDPFRRLELRACADAACTEVIARALGRRTVAADARSWHISDDSTVPVSRRGLSHRRLTVRAPDAVAWQLWYLYGDRRFEHMLPPDEVGFLIDQGALGR